ncbi:subtilisin-like protein [Glonium stellatum]|uniref:Subtilisin-like protein n=1 Tax=Glonium stellatum TaxID=574774 RepID=A0A8E2JZ66_9PEZI|nr:subtilisin-like protein [Glonium stellatum]
MEQEQRTDQAWNSLNGGKYSDAAAFFEDAMRWSEANYGLENEDTLHLRDNLGKCLQELENFKEAKDLSQETLRARERLQGSDNPDTIKTRHALAVNLSRLGRYKDSIELHRLNMLYQEKSASQNYLGMLETRQCLESDLYSIGEPQEALMLDEGTQRLRELVRDITLANQNDPNQGDPMAIVAGADGWAMLCPEEMEAWRKKLTKWAEEREKLLRTNQEEGKTRKEERPERMTEGGQKKKAGEGEKYKTRDGRNKNPGLGRSSSVPPAQKYHQHAPPLFDVQRESGNKSLQRLADGWFLNLERYTERLVASYRKSPYDKVRIAILDTGIEKSSRATTPDEIRSHGNRIKAGKSFVANEPAWNQDSNGHGTHAAGLLLRVARGADIYIARILRGNEKTINTENVVEALKCCIDEWNVDIISMSFGYEKEQPEIEKQLKRADNHNILVFAAASNDGASKPINIAWPARATNVMCVNSATGEGNNSGFNPPMDPKKWNFAMLGEEVNSTWPLQLIKEAEREENGGTKRKSGTSFATPIAAATAALVLEFARQPPLSNNPKVAEYLKKFSGMQEVFMLMSERKEGKFYYVYPWKLLNSTFGKGTSRGIGRADHNDANDRYSARGMVESSILNMVAKNVQIF